MIAEVIIDLALDRGFDYAIPASLAGTIGPGSRVKVPFGKGERQGFVLAVKETADFKGRLREIISADANSTRLPANLLNLAEWMSQYYCCAAEHAVRTLLPAAVRSGRIKEKVVGKAVVSDRIAANEYISRFASDARAALRLRVLQLLLDSAVPLPRSEVLEQAGAGPSALKTLAKAGVVELIEEKTSRSPWSEVSVVPTEPLPPTPEQEACLKTVRDMLDGRESRRVMLIRGVTGSGKTEVYLQAIAMVLERGGNAIVLVPEISLTPQTVRRFRARFGEKVSVLHSRLSDGERFDEWNRIRSGQVQIAVGARSALFAPFPDVALIVVDEEHEDSYKQSETPRYHARDVAVKRGAMEGAVVLLGSATPSLESYTNSMNGKYVLCELLQRAESQPLPAVRVVDLSLERQETDEGKSSFFSPTLIDAVKKRLAAGEQTILFLNRRGYARKLECEDCGYTASCPDCAVAYTYHRKHNLLSCRYCGAMFPAPAVCPQCGNEEIRYVGSGTERIESQARAIFPEARIFRMDSDTMRSGRHTHESVLNRFRSGDIDILIGTQMIAKGLHFPGVTLVGVLNADAGLVIPDFRGGERSFQLLTQVAGRAGRGDLPGEVIFQSFDPSHPVIEFAVRHDFKGFADYELEIRKELDYPPFTRMAAVHFESADGEQAVQAAEDLFGILSANAGKGVTVSPPEAGFPERLAGKFRYLLLVRGENLGRERKIIRDYILKTPHPQTLRISADIDVRNPN